MFILRRSLIICSFVFGLSSCKSEPHAEPAFYYWKTRFALSSTDSSAVKALSVRRLYVRFFDVADEWNADPVPVGRLENQQPFPAGVEIVPVVFIQNSIFSKRAFYEAEDESTPIPDYGVADIDSSKVRELAENLVRKTMRMAHRYSSEQVREIQLDCDWTPSTRDKYFYLISEVKRLVAPLEVSATIRLHQFKYTEKTGVPPADRGMLMYYNMSRLKDTATANYILDNVEGEKYIKDAGSYPLPLDFALPIHSQGTAFFRNEYDSPIRYQFQGLLTSDQFELLRSLGDHLQPVANSTKYILTQDYDFNAQNMWLHPGLLIRYDEVSDEALLRAAEHVARLANTERYHVVFFHLDSLYLTKHSSESLAHIMDQFN